MIPMVPLNQSEPRDCSHWIVRYRTWLFAFAVLVTGLTGRHATQLLSDQSVAALFAKNDPRVQAFRRSKALFGGDELAFFCYTDPDLNTPAGMARLRALSQELSEVPGILTASVQDLATSLDQARLAFINIPPQKFRELTHRVLIGDDKITTAVVLRFAPLNADDVAVGAKHAQVVLAQVPRAQTVAQIRDIAAKLSRESGLDAHLVGEPVQELDAEQYVDFDNRWLWLATAGAMGLVLLIAFRNLRHALIPLLIAAAVLTWIRALAVWYGVQLGMVSSMLNPMVMIVAVGIVIPLMVRYRDHVRTTDCRSACLSTLREMGLTIWGVSLIAALGSAALLTSEIYPLAEFGALLAVAAILTFPAICCILPFGLLIGTAKQNVPVEFSAVSREQTNPRPGRFANAIAIPLSLAISLSFIFALAGCWRVQIETDFIKNFRPSSSIATGLDFVERHFGGSATWEVNFPTPDELTEEFLAKVENMAIELRQVQVAGRPALTKVICLADGEAIVPRTFFTSQLSRRLWLLDKLQAEYVSTLYNAEEQRMRLILRSLERQTSQEKLEIIRQVTETTRKHFPEAEATGIFVLLTFLIEHLLREQWVSLGVASACISMVIAISLRSLKFCVISVLPNAFAVVLVIGSMGWLNLPVNIASAMMASISVGLLSGSTFQFLSNFRQGRLNGLDVSAALNLTQNLTGRATILRQGLLFTGCLTLTASHFIPVINTGIMGCWMIVGSAISHYCLLPGLLRLTTVNRMPTTLPVEHHPSRSLEEIGVS